MTEKLVTPARTKLIRRVENGQVVWYIPGCEPRDSTTPPTPYPTPEEMRRANNRLNLKLTLALGVVFVLCFVFY